MAYNHQQHVDPNSLPPGNQQQQSPPARNERLEQRGRDPLHQPEQATFLPPQSASTYYTPGLPSPSFSLHASPEWEYPTEYTSLVDTGRGPAFVGGRLCHGRAAAWVEDELGGYYAGESYDEQRFAMASTGISAVPGTTSWAPPCYDYAPSPTPLHAPKAVYPNAVPSSSSVAQYNFSPLPSFAPPSSHLLYLPPHHIPNSGFHQPFDSNYSTLDSPQRLSHHQPGPCSSSIPPASSFYVTSSRTTYDFQQPRYPEEPPPPALLADIPPPSSIPVPTVSLAATNRLLFEALPSPLAVNAGRKRGASEQQNSGNAEASTSARPNQKTSSSRKKATPLELQGRCCSCDNDIARLVLRSTELGLDLAMLAPKAGLLCAACITSIQPRAGGLAHPQRERSAAIVLKKPSYADTLSAAVDRLAGIQIASHEEVFPMGLTSESFSPSKEALSCDVCDRIIAAGSVTLTGGRAFTVEVICCSCDRKYMPCSDCGGGGGRLTAGTWRCTELFVLGRRTCRLLHVRNPTLEEMTFEVHDVTDLSPESLPGIQARCRQFYFHSRLSSLSRPDSLERGEELGRSFAEIERMTIDSWALIEQHLSDVNISPVMRRYLGTQLSVPHERRAKDKGGVKEKAITGFIFAELDLSNGAIFISTVMPWAASGHALQGVRILNQAVVDHAFQDVATFNLDRTARHVPPYPPVCCTWFMSPFKRDSRLMASALKSGYVFAEDYFRSYPVPDRSAFPPERETWIPRQFVHAWEIMMRPAEPGRLVGKKG